MSGAAAPAPERIGRDHWVPIGAMALGILVITNDFTAMGVLLPDIEAEFDTDVSTVQWVVNAYSLVFGVLIVTGGRLADMFGRRQMYFLGAAFFAVFSLMGAMAPNVGVLIAGRALMGIGGALMWPAILGLVYAVLPEDRAGLAGGIVIGVAGLGNAMGPLLAGALADALSWRWLLLVNVPVAIVASLVIWRTVHVPQDMTRGRIDYAGIGALSLGLVSIMVALDLGSSEGWTSAPVLSSLALGVVMLGAFAVIERRMGDDALVPPDVMRNRAFTSACLAVLLMSSVFFAVLFYIPQYLQKILDWSALGAGAGLVPMMVVFAATSFVAGSLYNRLGAKLVVSIGAVGMCLGPFLMSFVGADSAYLVLVPGLVVLGIGVGVFYSSITTAGVTALDESRSSLAGGVIYMFQLGGGSLGLAISTAVFLGASNAALSDSTAQAGVQLSTADQQAVQGVLAGTDSANDVLAQFPGQAGDQLVQLVRDAFAAGLRWTLRFDAALAFAGLVLTVLFVGGRLRGRSRPEEAAVLVADDDPI